MPRTSNCKYCHRRLIWSATLQQWVISGNGSPTCDNSNDGKHAT